MGFQTFRIYIVPSTLRRGQNITVTETYKYIVTSESELEVLYLVRKGLHLCNTA